MWLSTRKRFGETDPNWADYVAFVGLAHLREVRTIDTSLNAYVGDRGELEVTTLEQLHPVRAALGPVGGDAYVLLYLDAEKEQAPPAAIGARLLGHDLSDETHTSSLLNCGRWEGVLAPLTRRRNAYGLLTFDDAVEAKALLPRAWPGDPHARVTVWALYELAPPN